MERYAYLGKGMVGGERERKFIYLFYLSIYLFVYLRTLIVTYMASNGRMITE
jgi:hypothetical protein